MSLFGPLSPGTLANDASVGTVAWTSEANAGVRDEAFAEAALTLGASSQYLSASGFGFSVPSQLTVLGVIVEILRNGSFNQVIGDASIRLLVGGVAVGEERAVPSDAWPSLTQRYRRYGDAVDLWGLPWLTAEQVNGTDFGVLVSATDTFDEGAGATAIVDHIQLTVCCTDA